MRQVLRVMIMMLGVRVEMMVVVVEMIGMIGGR